MDAVKNPLIPSNNLFQFMIKVLDNSYDNYRLALREERCEQTLYKGYRSKN
jgi:hypothetical protein